MQVIYLSKYDLSCEYQIIKFKHCQIFCSQITSILTCIFIYLYLIHTQNNEIIKNNTKNIMH